MRSHLSSFISLLMLIITINYGYAQTDQEQLDQKMKEFQAAFANAGKYTGVQASEVIKVTYTSRKFNGNFTKTGPGTWIETNPEGVFNLYETKRQARGEICLEDTARNKRYYIDLNKREVSRSKIGKFVSLSLDYYISKIHKSSDQANPVNPDTRNLAQDPKQATQTAPVTSKQDMIKTGSNETFDIPELNKAPVYHAILIAENKYSDKAFNSLPGTLRDVRKLYSLLTTRYTFEPNNTDTLVNASRETILSILNAKAKSMTENDNLFIFYAGHGWVKPYNDGSGKEEGFLIPCDAVKDDEVTFINSDDITRIFNRGSKARHILFTADACFAGSLFRDIAADAPLTVKDAYKEKSRKLLSSGNRQAVSDESDFVEYFRLALQENRSKYITAEQLVDGFKKGYMEKSNMSLQYYPIQGVGDMGGQFVFTRR